MSESSRSGRSSGGLVPGLFKGLATTARSVTRHNHTAEYPDVKPALPPRSRGVIALTEENCTSCMLCARECPDWCIYIDSHKEEIPATTPGGRARQRNVLDRFAIDFSLCMYCGICIEACPFDALHWSPEFEYSEVDIRDLLHEKGRLGEWMATVPPPPALDPGSADPAELTALSKPARPAVPGAAAARATTARRAAPGAVPAKAAQSTEPAQTPEPAEPVAPTSTRSAQTQSIETVSTEAASTEPASTEAASTGAAATEAPSTATQEMPMTPPSDEPGPALSTTRVMPAVTPESERSSAQPTVALPVQSPAGDDQPAPAAPAAPAEPAAPTEQPASAEPTAPAEPAAPAEAPEPPRPPERPSSAERPASSPERPSSAPDRPAPEGDS